MSEAIKYKINNAEFEARFTLSTAPTAPDGGDGGVGGKSQGDSTEINFSKSAIRGMDIEENFLEPFTNGNIYINNPLDFIEDGKLIRGDGRDKFTIYLKPVNEGDGTGTDPGDEKSIPLEYSFVISSEFNSASKTDRLNNFKTYRLLDRNYFLLSEQIPYGRRFRGKVGCIIRDILAEFGIPTGEWDCGDHEIDIFPEHILPPSTFRYSDLIKYLIQINYKWISTCVETCGGCYVRLFLNWCRRCKSYKYLPLSDPFLTPKIREGFSVDDLVTKCGVNPNNPITAPGFTPHNLKYAALAHTDFSTPMLTYSNTYLNNLLVSTYDSVLGEHVMSQVRIKEVKKGWKVIFVEPFKYIGGSSQPWVVLNNVKSYRLFRNLGMNFTPDRMRALAEAELTTNMTLLNLQLAFQTLGNTDRQPGEMVDVSVAREMKESEGKNPFERGGGKLKHRSDAKLLGQWFVTKIRHEFTTAKVDNYTNVIQCIKPHMGPGEPVPSDGLS